MAVGDFFFQAEDGIRDGTVTGVQTCALPIYEGRHSPDPRRMTSFIISTMIHASSGDMTCVRVGVGCQKIGRASCRKECRSRWVPYHVKKNSVEVEAEPVAAQGHPHVPYRDAL